MSVVCVSKAVLPILRQQGSDHIFQISSVGGRLGVPGLSAYQSAKWAVGGFSTVLAREVAPLGINATVVEPDGMKTDWPGLSMQIPPVSKLYESTVGFMADKRRKNLGKEPSILTKVASIIIGLSNEEDPPLQLLIGPDAVEHALSQHLTQSVECFFSLVQPPPVAFRDSFGYQIEHFLHGQTGPLGVRRTAESNREHSLSRDV